MHPNKAFRQTSRKDQISFARSRSFGILTVNAKNGPLVSHIPFQLNEEGTYLEAHLVKSNPIVELAKEPINAVLVVSGPDAYISPDWYELDSNQVPTWNYVAVHLRGTLRLLESTELTGILDRLSSNMEARLAPKPPWKIDKLDPRAFGKMQEQITPVAMDIVSIEGTWKLSQNKPEAVRQRVSDRLKDSYVGHEISQIAGLISDTTNDSSKG